MFQCLETLYQRDDPMKMYWKEIAFPSEPVRLDVDQRPVSVDERSFNETQYSIPTCVFPLIEIQIQMTDT